MGKQVPESCSFIFLLTHHCFPYQLYELVHEGLAACGNSSFLVNTEVHPCPKGLLHLISVLLKLYEQDEQSFNSPAASVTMQYKALVYVCVLCFRTSFSQL